MHVSCSWIPNNVVGDVDAAWEPDRTSMSFYALVALLWHFGPCFGFTDIKSYILSLEVAVTGEQPLVFSIISRDYVCECTSITYVNVRESV